MKIDKVELNNFKTWETKTYDFTDKVTVITGPNGFGKSSIIQAISTALLAQAPTKPASEYIKKGASSSTVKLYGTYKNKIGTTLPIGKFAKDNTTLPLETIITSDSNITQVNQTSNTILKNMDISKDLMRTVLNTKFTLNMDGDRKSVV
jgi:recombinational DNA repair ATPase RecF